MMRKRLYKEFKRGLAVLAAAVMVLQSPLACVSTYAQQGTQVSATEAGIGSSTVSENEVISQNDAQDIQNPAEDTQAPGSAQEDGAAQADLLLGYVYIEHAQVDVQAGLQQEETTQNILVSLGEGAIDWKEAELTLVHEESGEETVIPYADASENVLRFAFETKDMKQGVYRVAKVAYAYAEGEVKKAGEIVFADVPDMENVCFGLGVENPIPNYEFTQYDENANVTSAAEDLIDVEVVQLTGADDGAEASSKIANAVNVTRNKKNADSTVVMLDPGHDASHAGARANGLKEEALTLKVAKYCRDYLEDNYKDVVVYMTRSGEACPYPGTSSGDCNASRVDAANAKGADVYVSLHFNSTAEAATSASGAIVFYPNSNYNSVVGAAGSELASAIIAQLAKLGLRNGGIRIRNSENNSTYADGSLADYYGVIKRSKLHGIPAVIVEHAFLNNASDAAFLAEEGNLKKLGEADAIGIANAYELTPGKSEITSTAISVTDIDGANGTFKMTVTGVSPVERVETVKFKVYPTADKKKSHMYEAKLTDEATGTYSVVGNVSEHGMLTGEYKVIAYAYTTSGKTEQLRSVRFDMQEAKPDANGMLLTCKSNSSEKKVTITLKGNANAAKVTFKVYSKDGGKDDLKKYTATKKANGDWKAVVKIADHKSMGDYVVQVYSKSHFGTTSKIKTGSFHVYGPSVEKIQVTKLNLTKGTFRVIARGVDSKAGVKKVTLIIKNSKTRKTYATKKAKSGYYYADINMKDFGYKYGKYKIYAQVKDGNGIEENVKSYTKQITQPDPVFTMKVKSKQTKISMKASKLGISANVKGVRFKVYHSSKPSKKKTYEAKKNASGSYSATMDISDFGKSGDYKIITYVKGANGKFKKVGTTQTVNVADIAGGKVTTKKKTSSSMYLAVSEIAYKGKIDKVQVKIWPTSNKKAKYTYTAKKRSNGSYRATVNSNKHKGIGGEYSYQIIVTAKNGIKKTLLKGKVTLGESTPDTEGLYEITGASNVTVSQMVAYYKANASYPEFYANTDASTLKKFCQLYYDECEAEGIRAEVAFAQAMKETNFLRYGGDVDISQFNFAGIGATGGGAKGNSFSSVKIGIRAQVQHLKAYANSESLKQAVADPRFQYVERGCAPYVEWLGIKTNPYGKGWATDPTYGSSLRQMIETLLTY